MRDETRRGPLPLIPHPSSLIPPAGRVVGLLAGGGRFPLAFAHKARRLGLRVVCVGLRGEAPPELAGCVAHFHGAGVLQLGRIIRLFRRHGVTEVVMAGKVHKANYLHAPWRLLHLLPDLRGLRFFYNRGRGDNKDDSLLLAVIAEFARDGITCTSALDYCPELLVSAGRLTRRGPTPGDEADIAFGWGLAKRMGDLDVGQSVCVKDRAVLAVEAVEGTDRCIARAGELCRAGGFVVVKVAKPHQDMRFDVPTVGTATVEAIHRAGGRVLAVEAGKTILLDEAATVALADKYGIAIVARPDAG